MLINKDMYYAVIDADGSLIVVETTDPWFEGLTDKYPSFEIVSGLELESYLEQAGVVEEELLRTDADATLEDLVKEEEDCDYDDGESDD